MAIKVTVVVPTYNSGSHIEPLVRSMLAQTLPADEFEVLFVDDGSTDGTPARLHALAAEHEHFRVTEIPNSGWPGKPRNVGVEQARGAYVQFVDHDDRMAPEALERLHAMADRNASDIVIGKVASNFLSRGVPYGLMSTTREKCTVHDASLIDSLTPHKMFRTAFLREHGIVHPEGPWILEDQLFLVRSYLKAEVVSVLGDYVCYTYWARDDEENAGTTAMDPRRYYSNLREILDTVVAGTEPGPGRDRLLRRFYRVEMLSRLGVPARGAAIDPRFDRDPFEAVRELAEAFVTDGVHAGLAANQRVRSDLLRADRPAELTEYTGRQTDLTALTGIEDARWDRDRLKVDFTARFAEEPGGPGLLLSRRGERYVLAPKLTDGILDEPVDVTDELKSFRVNVLLRNTRTAHLWPVPAPATLSLEEEVAEDGTVLVRPVLTGTAAIDPARGAGGSPLDAGTWDVQIRVMGAGFDRNVPLGNAAPDGAPLPAPSLTGVTGGHRATPVMAAHATGAGTGLALTLSPAPEDAADGAPLPPRVSVVVPTGGATPQAVRETLDSVAAQTLPAADIETVLVGDGEGAVRPSAGADPRNSGIDAAHGRYVLFMEAGDRLAPRALERLYAYGMENDADVVVGKLAAKDRGLPKELFVRDRPRATLAKDPLADSLTANKLFDRAFLLRHGLRFPPADRPLAEQAFTSEAYLRAGHVSVLGSHVCYHYGPKRDVPAPAPADFYAALAGLMRKTDSLTGPGPARDRLHRRWLRVEVLDRLTGKAFLETADENRLSLLREIRTALAGRPSRTAVDGLPLSRRIAFGLIEDDRPEDFVRLARWEHSLACRSTLAGLERQEDGTLRLSFTAAPHAADGPVRAVTDPDGTHTLAPSGLPETLLKRFAAESLTAGAAPEKATAVLVLRERSTGAEYRLPTACEVRRSEDGELTVAGTAALDPATAAGGAALADGAWDLYVRLTALGWTKTARLGRTRAPEVAEELKAFGHPADPTRTIAPYWTKPHRDLSLRVEVPKQPPAPRKQGLLRRVVRAVRGG
ncbi:glycosyltransferase [Streptomyces sp. B1I3]|uniref:glycosyltransferase n=1 Tax=Streptomyces sp. B1I3 TaxID=3042264 RepID=UPI0027871110|nr:glycosyltransferase [Streptomyces sp. B1I3]MDQ0794520.1 glycosyltransferase involved in cell wall biosynthesis [Streptomyces sp. B1I3]